MSSLFPFVRTRGAAVYVLLIIALAAATAGGGLGDGARLARVVRFDARLLRTWPADVDVLEGLDLLHDAVLEDLEVVRGQIANRHALEGRIRVHANEVRAHTESRLIGGRRLRVLRLALRRRGSPVRLRL